MGGASMRIPNRCDRLGMAFDSVTELFVSTFTTFQSAPPSGTISSFSGMGIASSRSKHRLLACRITVVSVHNVPRHALYLFFALCFVVFFGFDPCAPAWACQPWASP